MKISLFQLYMIFFKVSIIMIGGGYVLLPVSFEEFANKRKLLTKEEIVDIYTLSQCLPGIITINTSVFIGYHLKGKMGALVSVLGVITPPFFAILLLANLLQTSNTQILSIINTVTISVIVLVGASFVELSCVCLKNIFTVILFFLTIVLFLFSNMPPVTTIVLLTLLGFFAKFIIRKLGKEEK